MSNQSLSAKLKSKTTGIYAALTWKRWKRCSRWERSNIIDRFRFRIAQARTRSFLTRSLQSTFLTIHPTIRRNNQGSSKSMQVQRINNHWSQKPWIIFYRIEIIIKRRLLAKMIKYKKHRRSKALLKLVVTICLSKFKRLAVVVWKTRVARRVPLSNQLTNREKRLPLKYYVCLSKKSSCPSSKQPQL